MINKLPNVENFFKLFSIDLPGTVKQTTSKSPRRLHYQTEPVVGLSCVYSFQCVHIVVIVG